jgi:hypothetical protein
MIPLSLAISITCRRMFISHYLGFLRGIFICLCGGENESEIAVEKMPSRAYITIRE